MVIEGKKVEGFVDTSNLRGYEYVMSEGSQVLDNHSSQTYPKSNENFCTDKDADNATKYIKFCASGQLNIYQ